MHESPEALQDYLSKHPDADKSKHVVKKDDEGDKSKGESKPKDEASEEHGHKEHSLGGALKSLGGKALAFFKKAPSNVRKFVENPESRKETIKAAVDGLKEAPGKIAKGALNAAKNEIKEFKTAGEGVAAVLKGKKPTPEQKKAIRTVAIDVAVTVAVTALSGGLAGGLTGLAKSSALAFAKGLAKKVALNAVTHGLGNLATLEELAHGAHAVLHHVKLGKKPSQDDVFGTWIESLVIDELSNIKDDDLAGALEGAAGETED